MKARGVTLFLAAANFAGRSAAQTYFKQEPPPGSLKTGEVVIVDDGVCPPGRIKEVTGGTNIQDGKIIPNARPRTMRCIDARKP